LLLCLLSQEHGLVRDKPYFKQHIAQNMVHMAAHDTRALLGFTDFDEFLVIPSGRLLQQLVAPGGCLAGVRQHAQAVIRSKVSVALSHSSSDEAPGEFPAWLQHSSWVEAVAALNYSMAPQAFLGWKSIVDPNFDYNFNCEYGAAGPACQLHCSMMFASEAVQRTHACWRIVCIACRGVLLLAVAPALYSWLTQFAPPAGNGSCFCFTLSYSAFLSASYAFLLLLLP
jgi:hypothetical protein